MQIIAETFVSVRKILFLGMPCCFVLCGAQVAAAAAAAAAARLVCRMLTLALVGDVTYFAHWKAYAIHGTLL